MLYIIGLGLNVDGISTYGLEVVKKCKKIYLENYTVDFPYSMQELIDKLGKKFELADREFVESFEIIDEAEKKDVALLVYGSPFFATTHIALIQEAKASELRYKVIYNASVFDALGETGLQLYKFGKISSMPMWKKNYEPDSFMEIVKENESINAHSLILIDPGMTIEDTIIQLEKAAKNKEVKLGKLIVCQALGTRHRKILYRDFSELKKFSNVKSPYCIIIPGKLHFLEKEMLENYEEKN
ncbi:MAG: diphthine synthase [Nanoarchaeota archaeon]|nr:diphthine synthase [Nanoarchaeota archaeon]